MGAGEQRPVSLAMPGATGVQWNCFRTTRQTSTIDAIQSGPKGARSASWQPSNVGGRTHFLMDRVVNNEFSRPKSRRKV